MSYVQDWAQELYAERGRPSIDPVVFFKLQLIMFFEGIRSERKRVIAAGLQLLTQETLTSGSTGIAGGAAAIKPGAGPWAIARGGRLLRSGARVRHGETRDVLDAVAEATGIGPLGAFFLLARS